MARILCSGCGFERSLDVDTGAGSGICLVVSSCMLGAVPRGISRCDTDRCVPVPVVQE